MDKPRIPVTWSDWVSGDWLGAANPMSPIAKVAPVVAGSIDTFARVVGATLGAASERGGPAAPQFIIEQILSTARARLVGRDLTLKNGSSALHLVLDDLVLAQPACHPVRRTATPLQITTAETVQPVGAIRPVVDRPGVGDTNAGHGVTGGHQRFTGPRR